MLFALLAAGIFSCKNNESQSREHGIKTGEDPWTVKMKAKILADFSLGTDSTLTKELPDGIFYELKKYRQGHLVLQQIKSKQGDLTVTEVIYAGNGHFEIRREYCKNGQMAFEGIVSNDDFYGQSTWWECDGRVYRQGMKYRSKLFGKWYFDMTDSTKMRMDSYGLLEHYDSLDRMEFK